MDNIIFRVGYVDWLAVNPARQSIEVDYGFWWSMETRLDQRLPPFWRVSWIANTGELYAVDRTRNRFFVIGVLPTRQAVDEAMEGWELSELDHHCDLRWWTDQVRAYIQAAEWEKERTEK